VYTSSEETRGIFEALLTREEPTHPEQTLTKHLYLRRAMSKDGMLSHATQDCLNEPAAYLVTDA
jgi:hypothetical protein